jgi:hypothetical protein
LWIRRLTCFPCDFIQFFRIQIQIVSVFLCAMYLFFYWIELNNGVLRCGVFCSRYCRHRNAALESEHCPNGTTHYISIFLDNIQVLFISTFQKYVATIFPMEEGALNFRGNVEHSCLYFIFCRFEPNSDPAVIRFSLIHCRGELCCGFYKYFSHIFMRREILLSEMCYFVTARITQKQTATTFHVSLINRFSSVNQLSIGKWKGNMVIKISYLRVLLSFCWFNHTKLVFE